MSHVVIIGAGIVGVSTAVWLQRDGHQVTLVDRKGPAEGASYGNGGVLASSAIVPVTGPGLVRKAPRMALDRNQPLFLKWSYLPKLAPWLVKYLGHANANDTQRISNAIVGVTGDSLADHQALAEGTGAEKWIVPSDYLFVYRDRAAYEAEAFAWSIRARHGFEWEELDGPAFRGYDPIFSPNQRFAIRLDNHGRIADPGNYVKDLAAHVEANGGAIRIGEVTDIARGGNRVTGVRMGGETLSADAVVLATGAWSGPLAKTVGLNVPLESERGYHIELWGPSAMPRAPVMISSGKFVVTPMDGRLRLAGVVEFGGLDAPPSRAPFDLLRKNAREVFPDLTWEREVEWMGHRPATTDSIPVIGEVPGIKGAYAGFGHHHIGLTAGPKTGRLLAQLICGKRPNLDLAAYSPARFAT